MVTLVFETCCVCVRVYVHDVCINLYSKFDLF